MQVDAVYENGKITLLQPVNFKNSKFKLKVSIPDEEVESEIESSISKYYEMAKQTLKVYRDMIDNFQPKNSNDSEMTLRDKQREDAAIARSEYRKETGRL